MNIANLLLVPGKSGLMRLLTSRGRAAMFLILLGMGAGSATSIAQQPESDEDQEVLTRGPVHEAFAGIVSYDPEPGEVIPKAPPELIEEIPPEERPDGDNVAWIPGYWAWDDERNDFLWISGTWRALPPGREWIAGYWNQNGEGYQWISGYWADAVATETTYLPPPPTTVEAGPNIAAPSDDYGWTPGCWIWLEGRYAWRPGYWTEGRADWDWIPAHYVWTPRGYIFIEGYWDYSVERRGMLFAPVYIESRFYSRRSYRYSPRIVINLSLFNDHLFLRPRYHHYYFGDYYGATYQRAGFYASFSFGSGRRGYDPFYSHQRWVHRTDHDWERRNAASFQYRRDHEAARPPRTWSAQMQISARGGEPSRDRVAVAVSIEQLAKKRDGPTRFHRMEKDERNQLAERGREVQKSRDQRRTAEVQPGGATNRKEGVAREPSKVQQVRSPIVSRPADQLSGNASPPPVPAARPAPKAQPRADGPDRERQPNRSKAQPRKVEGAEKSTPGQNAPARPRQDQPKPGEPVKDQVPAIRNREPKPRENSERRAKPEAQSNPEQPDQRKRDPEKENRKRNDRSEKAKEREVKAQEKGASAENVEKARSEEAAQQQTRALGNQKQQERNQQEGVARVRAQEESRRKAQESAMKDQVQVQRRAQEKEQPPQIKPVPPSKREPSAPARKKPPKPRANDEDKERGRKSSSPDNSAEASPESK